MKYVGLLLFCLLAVVSAKPAEELELLLRRLLEEIDGKDVDQRGIGAVKYGGTNVGEDYIEVKVIRHMDEVEAESTAHKPRYSLIYGKGQHDPNNIEHSTTSAPWNKLDKCQNGAEGCFMIKNLTPNTMYWVQLEVQMWVDGKYQYIKSKRSVKQIRTKRRELNAP